MSKPKQTRLTKHAVLRFAERYIFKSDINLEARIHKYGYDSICKQAREVYFNSREEKAYINNTNLMSYLYDHYGYDRHFKIKVSIDDKLVFIVIMESKEDVIVTCMETGGGFFRK